MIMLEMIDNISFKEWVGHLKQHIRQSQIKAAIKVNSELLHLYWEMGYELSKPRIESTYGSSFFSNLSKELMSEFPHMKGFSKRNLYLMRQWYLFYNQSNTIVQQVVAQSDSFFFSVPWGHHCYIIARCKTPEEAIFYLNKTVENGWSRGMLLNFLDVNLYQAQRKSINNFSRYLPEPQSELAQETLKDPYNFDFLTLTEGYKERELEDALTNNITKFLLELGKGFAYVGRQYPITVGNNSLFIDLLFYHLELRCYIVIELKAVKFEAEFTGKLGLYVSAVNHQMKKATDNPTIGLVICKSKDDIIAQYSLESSSQPIGISAYELSKLMPENIKSQLPSIEEIEASLKETKE